MIKAAVVRGDPEKTAYVNRQAPGEVCWPVMGADQAGGGRHCQWSSHSSAGLSVYRAGVALILLLNVQ